MERYFVNNTTQEEAISMWGVFKLVSGVMHVINDETNEERVDEHFGLNKRESSLRLGGKSLFKIENIVKDLTTWAFYSPNTIPGIGDFALNGDTTIYCVNYTNSFQSIIQNGNNQQLRGSARPFSGETIDYGTKTIMIRIQDGAENIDGCNYRYRNELTFSKIESFDNRY